MPMMRGDHLNLTFLQPFEKWATTAKIYTAPRKDALSSDYNLGKYFTYQEHNFRSLEQLAAALRQEKNQIVIYGKPRKDLPLLDDKFRRTTENFPYPDDQTLHCFDLDKWPVPEAVEKLHGWDLSKPDTTVAVVRDLLTKEGFSLLAQAECVVVLTSSMWGTEYLNCHLYYQFTEPIRVEAMRAFAVALARVRQRVVFDQAVYKAVQPQFFTPPTCLNFADPLEGARVIHVPGENAAVDTSAFQELARQVMQQAEWTVDTKTTGLASLGNDWQDTVTRMVGGDLGINEPCYRAAAQLVQEVGRGYALSHLDDLAREMWDLTWKTLAGKDTDRGKSQKDKTTYNVARFAQYIQSATEKPFAREVDKLTGTVREAIGKAEQGEKRALLGKPTLNALMSLKHSHPAEFIMLRDEIKDKKLVGLADLNMLMKRASASSKPQPGTGGDATLVSPEGETREENFIDSVIALYEYIEDQYGNRYAAVPGNGDGGYHMMRLNGDMVNVYYRDGLKKTGNGCSIAFGKKTLSKLMGEIHSKECGRFQTAFVGRRVVTSGQEPGAPSWFNLGLQPTGKHLVMRLTPAGPELTTAKECKVKWIKGTHPAVIAQTEEIEERFGKDADLTSYLLATLPQFLSVDRDSLYRVVMWCVSVLADKPLSYLAEFTGSAGCGKSTGADFLKDLIDPSGFPLGVGSDRAFFSKVSDDFLSDLERRHVTILDNLSKLPPRVQDALCMIATGMRNNERVLYTQGQMDRFIRKPLITTSLDTVITRPDLRTRTVQVNFHKAAYNSSLLEDWKAEKPFLLAALAQVTCKTLGVYAGVSHPPEDISSRDVFLACVRGALSNKQEPDFGYVREYRVREALEEAGGSGFLSAFIKFLDTSFAGQREVSLSSPALHRRMREWAINNAGENSLDNSVNPLDIPATARGFGWKLTQHGELIGRVSKVWSYNGKRSDKKVSVHHFVRKDTKALDSLL